MPNLGTPELIIILVVILIFFGVGKLPQVGSSIGKGLRAFRRAQQGEDEDEDEEVKTTTRKRSTKKATARATKAQKD